MEAAIERIGTDACVVLSDSLVKMRGVVTRIFGCWHRNMSLPLSRDKESYRTCVACGARRRFDLEQWVMVGPFYHQPSIRFSDRR